MQKDRALSLLIAMESALEDDRFEVRRHNLHGVSSNVMTERFLSCQEAMHVPVKRGEPASLCWRECAQRKRMTCRKQSVYARRSWRSLAVKGPSQLRESSMYNSSHLEL